MLERLRVARRCARWVAVVAVACACLTQLARADTATPVAQKRALYIQALEAYEAGRIDVFHDAMSQLVDYPLYRYLDYQDHRRRLSDLSPDDVTRFAERWSDSPIAGRLYDDWLDDLVARNAWTLFIEYYPQFVETYKPVNDVERRCAYLRALDRSGRRTEAMEQVKPLWMVGTTPPKECDPLFAVWIQRGNVNNGMVWDRLTLALQARSWDLARYLAGLLSPELRHQGELFYQVARKPELVRDTSHFSIDNEATRSIVGLGLRRLASNDPDSAAAAWAVYSALLFKTIPGDDPQQIEQMQREKRAISQDITIALARRGVVDPNADLSATPDGRQVKVSEALILASLNNKNWSCVISLIGQLDDSERNTERWRYWLGRAQRALSGAPVAAEAGPCPAVAQRDPPNVPADSPSPIDATAVASAGPAPESSNDAPSADDPWHSIASQRQYYGFLAAEALGKPPALNYQSNRPEQAELDAWVQQWPAMMRINELYALGDRTDARREWNFLLPRLDSQSRRVAPYVLADMGWTDLSIIAAGKMPELKDDLTLRFPSPYTQTFAKESKATTIPIGFLYGIARQESAFGPNARSPVGALGLMQLMPATAAQTARTIGESVPTAVSLFQPDLNVHIASRHLAELLERYDGNRVLAAAAYNAGAGRVDRWLRDRPARPADIWIDSIPFAETRDYVQNVMAFAYIYGQRLGHPTRFLDSDER